MEECIVGGSVAWNQLVPITSASTSKVTNNGDGTFTVASDANEYYYLVPAGSFKLKDHVYFGNLKNGVTGTCYLRIDSYDSGTPMATESSFIVKSLGSNNNKGISIRVMNPGTELTVTPQLFDLTALFGSTIADYIYSLEQATAGAGVAWFKKYFPEDYYEYSAPTLRHVEGVSQKEVVGFNQWDEEWRNGYYNASTGAFMANANYVANKNPIRVLPNANYYLQAPSGINRAVFFFDSNGNFISRTGIGYIVTNIQTPLNCSYIAFYCDIPYGTTYNHDICISLSDPTKNGVYEPYKKNIYPLDSSLTLRGIPKLTDGKMWFDGDKYEADGSVQRRYGIVDLGSLTWSKQAGSSGQNNRFMATLSGATTAISLPVCNKYVADTDPVYARTKDKVVVLASGGVYIEDTSYTDATSFKTAMSGVYLVYELATPTTEEATPYISLQTLNPYGIEEFVTTGIVPVGHYSEYPQIKINTTNIHNPYTLATTSAYGFMSANDKIKLNNIATGAEVNQNAFSNIKIGSSTVAADTKTDTLELVAGNYILLTPDTTNDKITIGVKDVTTTLNATSNLPTSNAVKTYIDTTAQNTYVTLTTTQKISGRKTFENLAAVTFKPSSGTDKCNINYNATLGALVFSF